MAGGSRGLILRLALRAIRWRLAASAAVFVVAAFAILAATVGPIYLHAVDETVLATHLKRATLYQRDVLVSRHSLLGYPGVDWNGEVRQLAAVVARDHRFASPVSEQQADIAFGPAAAPFKGEIASIEGLCSHLRMVRGRCLTARSMDDTVISQRTAAVEHLTVGGTFTATADNGVALRLRIVGVYRPIAPGGSFWAPWHLFAFGEAPVLDGPSPADATFVTPAALTSRLRRLPQTLSANVALRPGGVGYGDIGELRATIAQVHAAAVRLDYRSGASGAPVATVTTSLPTILDRAATETSLARTLVTVATVQLALLAILLLYAVVADMATVLGPEVALAKLRGRATGSLLLQSVAQPVALVLAASPVGALLAWVVIRLLAAQLLGRSVDVTFPPAAIGVAALGVAGGVLAAVAAARRIVVTPVGALLHRGAAGSGSATGLLLADAAAVALAVAGLVELKAGGVLSASKPDPLSVLAPTLLAVAAGVVVLRLLPFAGRALVRWTRDSRRLATFLVVRQLLRRPAEARAVLLVAVAVSIASFAIINWADARHNRSLRALNAAGAHTVLIVAPGNRVDDLRTAVDRADPSGQSMAVAYTHVDGTPPLIAVDTARFASVGAWVRGNAPVALRSALDQIAARRPAIVTLTGTRARLRVDLTRHPRQAVHLAVSVIEPNHERAVQTVARVAPGNGSYDISLPSVCASGCGVASLHLTADTPDPVDGGAGVSEIAAVVSASVRADGAWRPVGAFGDRARWRGDGTGPEVIRTEGSSLLFEIRQPADLSTWPAVVSASIPTAMPAIVASRQAALYPGDQIHDITAVGLDGGTATVDGVLRSVTLPRVDRDGMMVDFGTALATMRASPSTTTQYQVWLSASAPPDMAARLAREDVRVVRTIHASAGRSALDDSGPAFADSLFLIAALAATVLAIAATAVGRVVAIRRRGYALAALEAVGVLPRTLRRATAAEQGSVFGIGLIVGLVAGLVGSWLALPSTPVFVDTATGPPLVFGLPWGLLAVLTAGLAVVFGAVSVAIATLVERAATPSELRAAPQ